MRLASASERPPQCSRLESLATPYRAEIGRAAYIDQLDLNRIMRVACSVCQFESFTPDQVPSFWRRRDPDELPLEWLKSLAQVAGSSRSAR